MGKSLRIAAISLLLLMSIAGSLHAQTLLKPSWLKTLTDRHEGAVLAENGRCIVVTRKRVIEVLRPSGDAWWSWDFGAFNKYILPLNAAVSPGCDAIVVPGRSEYRYTWIVEQNGARRSVATKIAPSDAAFDHSGQFIALGTSGQTLRLLTRTGKLVWQRDLDVAITSDLTFSDDDQFIVLQGWGGIGLVRIDGTPEWTQPSNRMRASRDLKTFVSSYEPNHGPGWSTIGVHDDTGRTLWFKDASVEAFVSGSGQRILARIDDNQEKTEQDGFADRQPGHPELLTRDGQELVRFLPGWRPLALSDDGEISVLASPEAIKFVDARGNKLYEIQPGFSDYTSDFHVTRDFKHVMVTRRPYNGAGRLEWYDLP